jgi:hypothetical protein
LRTFAIAPGSKVQTFNLAGHQIAFRDCSEVGQGGPEVCTMWIDGQLVTLRYLWGLRSPRHFYPGPLEWQGDILIPLRETVRFYLARVDPRTLKVSKLGRGHAYMRLLRVVGTQVEISTCFDDSETHLVALE